MRNMNAPVYTQPLLVSPVYHLVAIDYVSHTSHTASFFLGIKNRPERRDATSLEAVHQLLRNFLVRDDAHSLSVALSH